jgi:DNA-binding response OmpR family regulator
MCRAIRVVVAAPDADALAALRRAVGVESEVVDAITDLEAVASAGGTFDVDVAVIDARTPDAQAIAHALLSERPRIGIVWAGDEPPGEAHATLSIDAIADDLPGTIVRALLARRTAGT